MMTKIILLGLCVCILNIVLRQNQSTFIILINISYAVIVVFLLFDSVADTVDKLKDLLSITATSGKLFSCLYKGAFICILTKVSADVCKESGNAVVSDIVDLAGRIMLIIIAFPFVESIIKVATAFVS